MLHNVDSAPPYRTALSCVTLHSMASNTLTLAWNTSQRQVGDWWIDSRSDSKDTSERRAAELLPEHVAEWKIEQEGRYYYLLAKWTDDEARLTSAADAL